jgi:chemotaxis protein histidine kinase CheA
VHEPSLAAMREALRTVEDTFADYARDYQMMFKKEGSARLLDNGELADRFLRAAQAIAKTRVDEAWQREWSIVQQTYFVPLTDLIASFRTGLEEIAAQLEKPTPSLQIQGDACLLKRSLLGSFSGIFIHLLRNAVDHGIESPLVRQREGKTPQGTIGIRSRLDQEHLSLDIYDDGKGLNLTRIQERARLKAYIQNDQNLTDDDIAAFIFKPGFSTKDAANDVSGRGVGMDAVRSMIEGLGGSLQIIWSESRRADGHRACAWRIILPRSVCLGEAA